MIKFVMVDGSHIKGDATFDSFIQAWNRQSNEPMPFEDMLINKVSSKAIAIKDASTGKKLVINFDNVLYIEECE